MAETGNTDSSRIIPSECPMHADYVKPVTPPSECPMNTDNVKPAMKPPSECPMHEGNVQDAPINPTNMMPPPNQQPSPNQPFELKTARQMSSIPKGGAVNDGEKWEYPSEQMFWNAMLRKGWRWDKDQVNQGDMSHIIRIHNHNNERAWNEVLIWEKFTGANIEDIKLVKFGGKAKEYSPRARLRAAMGYDLPFDRHDWIIDRNGKHVRYVIDYYDTGDENGYKTGEFVNLDVRPAFDSFGAAYVRSRAAVLRWAAGTINWWRQPKET